MANNTQIKDATTFPARADNLFFPAGKTTGNVALTELQAALAYLYKPTGGGAWPVGRPDANDAASFFRKHGEALVNSHKQKLKQEEVGQAGTMANE